MDNEKSKQKPKPKKKESKKNICRTCKRMKVLLSRGLCGRCYRRERSKALLRSEIDFTYGGFDSKTLPRNSRDFLTELFIDYQQLANPENNTMKSALIHDLCFDEHQMRVLRIESMAEGIEAKERGDIMKQLASTQASWETRLKKLGLDFDASKGVGQLTIDKICGRLDMMMKKRKKDAEMLRAEELEMIEAKEARHEDLLEQ